MGGTVTFDGYVLGLALIVLLIGSIYLSGWIAGRRGRSFKAWAWISGMLIGPVAVILLLLLPNRRHRNGSPA
jgi:MFS family permease